MPGIISSRDCGAVQRVGGPVVLAGLAALLCVAPVQAAMRIDCRPQSDGSTFCRIDQPPVDRRVTEIPAIRFQPGDRVTIDAGGCVSTGSLPLNWKRYVDPESLDPQRWFHGRIWIPGATPGLVRLAGWMGKPLLVRPGADTEQLFLRLGYEDDGTWYNNGYADPDPGVNNQCAGLGPAWVELRIEPPASRAPADRAPPALALPAAHAPTDRAPLALAQPAAPAAADRAAPALGDRAFGGPSDRVAPAPADRVAPAPTDRTAPTRRAGTASAEPTPAPFDLLWDTVDRNGLPLNPRWAYQTQSGSIPDPGALCDNFPYRDANDPELGVLFTPPACTTQSPWVDVGTDLHGFICSFGGDSGRLKGHADWGDATAQGTIQWQEQSALPPFGDADYNWYLFPDGGGLLTTTNPSAIGLEFYAIESIDGFLTPWWSAFAASVRNGDGVAHSMADGRRAIVTGLINLDCEHDCGSESHPVHAMAIESRSDVDDTLWAVFARNWGNGGYCSAEQQWLDLPQNTLVLRLPWRPGADAVRVDAQRTRFHVHGDPSVVSWSATPLPGQGIDSQLPAGRARGHEPGRGRAAPGVVGSTAASPSRSWRPSAAVRRLVRFRVRLAGTLVGAYTPPTVLRRSRTHGPALKERRRSEGDSGRPRPRRRRGTFVLPSPITPLRRPLACGASSQARAADRTPTKPPPASRSRRSRPSPRATA